LTGNLYSYRTCVNGNGHQWNTRKLVFTGTPYLFTSATPKHTLPSDVPLRRTTFCQPILPPSGPCNAPRFSSETLALYKSLTYLLIRLPVLVSVWMHLDTGSCSCCKL